MRYGAMACSFVPDSNLMAWSTFLHGSSIFLSSCNMTSPNSVRTSLISTLAKDHVYGHIFHHEYHQVLCLFMLDTLLEIDDEENFPLHGLVSSNTHHTHSRRRAISELLVRHLVCSTFISMPPHPFQEIHAQLAMGLVQHRSHRRHDLSARAKEDEQGADIQEPHGKKSISRSGPGIWSVWDHRGKAKERLIGGALCGATKSSSRA